MGIEGVSAAGSGLTYPGKVTTAEEAGSQDTKCKIVSVETDMGKDGSIADENGQRQPSEKEIKQALNEINKKLRNTECVFGVHDKTNRIMIKIIDRDTKEVIKEIPQEKTLEMIAKVWELAGILVDEKR